MHKILGNQVNSLPLLLHYCIMQHRQNTKDNHVLYEYRDFCVPFGILIEARELVKDISSKDWDRSEIKSKGI